MRRWFPLVVFLVLAAGCALTDGEIKAISDAVQVGVAAVAEPVITVAAPGIDAGSGAAAGIAGAVGMGVAFLVRWILTLTRKKTED